MSTISRREFLEHAGVLIVAFSSVAAEPVAALAQGPFDTRASHVDPGRLDSWIAVGADGTVSAFTGKCELGQGMLTAQTQLVAEELCVPVARVRVVMCDTDQCPDQGTTSGSQSTPTRARGSRMGSSSPAVASNCRSIRARSGARATAGRCLARRFRG